MVFKGLYAFFLAGSNFFAPVVCGFIAQYQQWQWVFYWASIFAGAALIYCFFFLEETNYSRATIGVVYDDNVSEVPSKPTDAQAAANQAIHSKTIADVAETGLAKDKTFKKKTLRQKLSLWQPSPGQPMIYRAFLSLRLLSWPVVFYAGFSYG